MAPLPTYDELPIDPSYPPHTAWGVWGADDNLGTLNLLTEDRVAQAAQECVQKGRIFPLNWRLESPSPPLFNRSKIVHQIRSIDGEGLRVFDDVYDNFNPQSSSQWDGLRHVCHLRSGQFYNGVKVEPGPGTDDDDRLGIHHMARHGIAGRAVLLDYARWAERQGIKYDPLARHVITVDELDRVAADQKVSFREGDILLVRTGWMAAYEKEGERLSERMDLANPTCVGIEASQATYRWVWNHHFAAVAGDHISFEAFPILDWTDSCHAQFLGGFGMPIGEMFNLEELARDCAQDGRYYCFFTSAPLNKYQGIATPPNALCLK